MQSSPLRFLFVVCLAICVVLLYAHCANAPGPDTPRVVSEEIVKPVPISPRMKGMLDDYNRFFTQEMSRTHTPGAAVVIVLDSQIVFMQGYGKRVVGRPDSVDVHTVFRIGSLSKGFAGVLTGQLVQDQVFDWEDPVQRYFPNFTMRDLAQAKRIRLWHLLSHTTGLPYHAFTNLIEEGYDTRRIISDYFPKAPVCGEEGLFFSYQNVAFCAIEEVMKNATGKSYQQLLMEKIFQPAGMTTASCNFNAIQICQDKANPHFQVGNATWAADTISPLYYNAAAAGGVNASIADMGEWLKVLLGNRPDVVSDATLDKVFTPVVKTGNERRIMRRWIDRNAASYAMGWRVLQHENDTIIYHGGYVNGFKGEIALNRRDKVGICVLFNGASELSGTCVEAFFDRWDAIR